MIERITHVGLEVEDQNEALRFYTDKLGFEKKDDTQLGPNVRWLTVAPEAQEDVKILLQSPDQFEGEEKERRAAMIGRSPGLAVAVDDCQTTYEELRERGVEFTSAPEEFPTESEEDPGFIEATATDLYGNPLILFEYTSETP